MNRIGLFSGYVIDNSRVNPVQVWVPALVNVPSIQGKFRTFGSNLMNCIGQGELELLRTICSSAENYFHMTMELSPGANCNATYYDSYGKTTTNSNQLKDNFPDLGTGKNTTTSGCSILQNMPAYRNPMSSPASLDIGSDAVLETVQGIKPEIFENAPMGNWTKLAVGTRVIVSYIDGGSFGVIMRQFPYEEEHAKTILNTTR